MLAFWPIVGFSESFTVTVKLELMVLPAVSVAVETTVVVPIGNTLPEAGLFTTVAMAQLSLAVGRP